MKVTGIRLLSDPHKADKIFLTTDLPCGTWPYKGFQTIDMEVARNEGIAYCHKHFPGIEIKIFLMKEPIK